jgi:alpha-tubulin suppressor-like RCC1 family protein
MSEKKITLKRRSFLKKSLAFTASVLFSKTAAAQFPGTPYLTPKSTGGGGGGGGGPSIPGMYAAGTNTWGDLALSSGTAMTSPTQVGALTNWSKASNCFGTSAFVKTDGTLWTCGYNANGALGTGDLTTRSSPTKIGTLTTWTDVDVGASYYSSGYSSTYESFTYAIKSGSLFFTGGDQFKVSASGNPYASGARSSPVQCGSGTTWSKISVSKAGNGTYPSNYGGIDTAGKLYTWGSNNYWQLGISDSNTMTIKSSPTQVGALTDWSSIKWGYNFFIARKTDNSLWACGDNTYGVFGGFSGSTSSPVLVGGGTSWAQYAVTNSVFAIKTDGTLWAWGYNSSTSYATGSLGVGSTAFFVTSPTQIGSGTNWTNVAATGCTAYGLKSDGTIWIWGEDYIFGLGSLITTPVQIGSGTAWTDIMAVNTGYGSGYTTYAAFFKI